MKNILTYSHIIAGSLSVITPIIVMLVKKGTKQHMLLGNIFFISMLLVVCSGITLSIISNTFFLLGIGVFTLYMLVLGKLAFRANAKWVRGIFILLFTILGATILLLAYISLKLVVVGSIFSVVTLFFTTGISLMLINDIKYYRLGGNTKVFHLTKMLGATIAAYTAFLVVNFSNYSPILTWVGPSVIGTALIIYLTKKMSKAQPSV